MTGSLTGSQLLLQLLCAAGGTIAFSVFFEAPVRSYPWCALIGSAGWFLYLWLTPFSSKAIATFIATVAVTLLSRWFAVRKQFPTTILLVPGIIPLVPGAGIYWAAYYVVVNTPMRAFLIGFESVKIVVAIVLGIVFVFEIPQKWFSIAERQK